MTDRAAEPQRTVDRQVLQLLFSFRWIEGEAAERGVTATDAEVRQSFAEQRRESFPQRADYRRFLHQSHHAEAEIRLLTTHTHAGALRARARVHRHGIHRGEERDLLVEDYGYAVETAVFRAPRGRIVGPLRDGQGYFVFEVVRIHPRHVMAMAEQRTAARHTLIEEGRQKALDAFFHAFEAKWRSRTTCAPAYVWDDDCGNWDGTPPD